ncbi:hypothetical protein PS2_028626 [Malus domestica]
MVTASQLQIIQSPITSLISTVSTSVTVKLDESNYLTWNFQVQLMLEGYGIMGFVDGSMPCPPRFLTATSSESETNSGPSFTQADSEAYKIWKMHDRALMQLITATLSPPAVSCVIGSTSAQDLWNRLKEQFSIVTRTSIFQMKSALQNIKKGNDSISLYLQRIKEARDYLSAASVKFDDEDIVILTLNGLSAEFNTIRSIIRGRDSVISLKDLMSQLLAEEAMLENISATPFMSAMVARDSTVQSTEKGFNTGTHFTSGGGSSDGNSSGYHPSSYRPFYNKNKGRGKFQYGSNSKSFNGKQFYNNSTRGILGTSKSSQYSSSNSQVSPCQICGKYGHFADTCRFRNTDSPIPDGCQICGKRNHSAQFCHFRNSNGPTSQSSMNAYHVTASTPFLDQQLNPQVWLTDSGATNHMTADLSNLSLATPYPSTEMIETANGEGLSVSHVGSSVLQTSAHKLKLNSVLCVPKLTQNLLSVHRLCLDNNCWLIFYAFCFWIQDKVTGRVLFRGLCNNGLYPIPMPTRYASSKPIFPATAFLGHQVNSSLWHSRLGHPSNPLTSLILKKSNIHVVPDSSPMLCTTCLEGKFSKLPFMPVLSKSNKSFEIVHSDVWGPAPCMSIEGFKYYVTFIDEYTRYCWIFPITNKSAVCSVFAAFYQYVLNHFSVSIKTLQSDGGGEYIGKQFQSFLVQNGITHHMSCPHTPEQNGLAERKHRHIIETSITLLQQAKLPPSFWSFACQTSVYLINRMPTQTLHHKSPFEVLFGYVPEVNHLRIFGCSCYPLLRPFNSTKLQPRTSKCVFLGYASKYKGFICYDVSRKKVFISRHVLFDEKDFPYSSLAAPHPLPVSRSSSISASIPLPVPNLQNVLTSPIVHTPNSSTSHSSPSQPTLIPHSPPPDSPPLVFISPSPDPPVVQHSSQSITAIEQSPSSVIPVTPDFQPEHLQVVLPIPSLNLHPMQTRSKSGISKKKALLATFHENEGVDLSTVEPATYKSTLKSEVWVNAIKEKLFALHSQGTWTLVPLPPTKNLVGCKWVFKIKRNADGTIGRYKARLVAKGFNQEEGVDYGETFSPVVKPTTVRFVLALAATFGWTLRQLDVKNAFLHGTLQEEVYMSQPPGFLDVHRSDYVCRLHKSLYGLKQGPRAWNDRFTSFLPTIGFNATYAYSSLFVKQGGSSVVILLLYVDDIIITGNTASVMVDVIAALTKEFEIKDLGPLHYFLGIQIIQHVDGLFLSQTKYVTDLLTKTEMLESESCATPCLPYNRLLLDDGKPFNNPALYRSIVGALQYLTFTRPDIAFAVHQVCQFMHKPMESHYVAVKMILRYLKGTVKLGINYVPGSMDLHAFSDADWAGDPNDRRSTTGFVVFLGHNPISWSSKKQQTVSRSSTEAEYRALSTTAAELDWIKQLLDFLQIQVTTPPILFCDNMSAIALSCNPVLHQRTKHIEVDIHFVRERVAKRLLQVQFVTSGDQFADILTKGLSAPLFRTHCNNLRLGYSSPELAGGC